VTIDILERDPTPFGLIRYGVAPDHPHVKAISKALKRILFNNDIRFFGDVNYGADLNLDHLQQFYDAVIFVAGARSDCDVDIPGTDLKGSFGAADFVSWYDGHPDVAHMLAKTADEQRVTEIPQNLYEGLKANLAKDVHVFTRRGPAQVKFTQLELRDLSHSPIIDVVQPEGFELDEGSMDSIRASKSVKVVVDEDGQVVGLRTEATELDDTGNVRGAGELQDWPVQAVYRAVGYRSDNLAGIPFNNNTATVPNDGGRVIDIDREPLVGAYVTGGGSSAGPWARSATPSPTPPRRSGSCRRTSTRRGIEFTTWEGWEQLDAHEIALGEAEGRTRVKLVPATSWSASPGRPEDHYGPGHNPVVICQSNCRHSMLPATTGCMKHEEQPWTNAPSWAH
jgi:ferredoxin--NADP+ reductase